MSAAPLKVAIVGHTNTGKTSLLRTLMRDVSFGEVSNRPAVTRHVEGATLLVNGDAAMELYDTPGLEDSIGLLDLVESLDLPDARTGFDRIQAFLATPDASGRFAQESKAIRQVIDSDVALFVIDARDRVLPRLVDELDILSKLARPIIPVLNFVASDDAKIDEWRAHLSKLNLHAVAEFDTVVFNPLGEERLFEKMKVLLRDREGMVNALISDRREARRSLIRASATLIAEMLIDVAAFAMRVERAASADDPAFQKSVDAFRERVRDRESECVRAMLDLHRFRQEDCRNEDFPIIESRWDSDLFDSTVLRDAGMKASGPAAAGAAAGLTLDVMFAGLSLGAATAIGAAIGATVGLTRTHGRRLLDRVRGWSALRCDQNALLLLKARQVWLARTLLQRGHATQHAVDLGRPTIPEGDQNELPPEIAKASVNPNWSSMDHDDETYPAARAKALDALAAALLTDLESD